MTPFELIAERRIREAVDRGELDHLPGAGRPLEIDERGPFEDPAWWAAYRLMRNAGAAPGWIDSRRELAAAADRVRARFRRHRDEERLGRELEEVNGRIRRHNAELALGVPLMAELDAAAELRDLPAERIT